MERVALVGAANVVRLAPADSAVAEPSGDPLSIGGDRERVYKRRVHCLVVAGRCTRHKTKQSQR